MDARERFLRDSQELLNHWNGKNIIVHDASVYELQIAARSALTKYGMDKTKQAIDRYAEAFHDQGYLECEYAWSLPGFLRTSQAMPQYLDDGEKWVNYCRFKQGYTCRGNELSEYQRMLAWLKRLPYKEYLKTEHWLHFKTEALKFFGHKCQHCGTGKKVTIHHKTYLNRGRETFSDVTALCKNCHGEEHGITGKGLLKQAEWEARQAAK